MRRFYGETISIFIIKIYILHVGPLLRLVLEIDNLSIKIGFLHFRISNLKLVLSNLKRLIRLSWWWSHT